VIEMIENERCLRVYKIGLKICEVEFAPAKCINVSNNDSTSLELYGQKLNSQCEVTYLEFLLLKKGQI
jgi:hypothetical protein